jgi:hypothetical protein
MEELQKGRRAYPIGTVRNALEKTHEGWRPVSKAKAIEIPTDNWILNEQGIKVLEKAKVSVFGARIDEKTDIYKKHFHNFNLLKFFTETKALFESNGLKVSKMSVTFDFTGETVMELKGSGFELRRSLVSDSLGENKYAFNNYFVINKQELRGKGIAKNILKLQYELDKKAGINKVEMFANMKDESPYNGCNTWGLFGWTTNEDHANRICKQAYKQIDSDIHIGSNKEGKKQWYRITEQDAEEVSQVVKDFYQKNDIRTKFPVILIHEKLGRERANAVMQKCEWSGFIDFSNEQQRRIWEEKLYGK